MGYAVTIPAMTISLSADLTDKQTFSLMSSLQTNDKLPGEVRTYANGRLRLVTKPGLAKAFRLSLPACTRAQIDWLKGNIGNIVLVRDDRGNKVYCTYFEVPVVEFSGDIDSGDVNLDLSQVTRPEDV